MSLSVTPTTELDETLRYECGQDIAVRVQLHRATGRSKKYPVELLYQGKPRHHFRYIYGEVMGSGLAYVT